MALRLLDIADGFASAGLPSDVTFTSAPFAASHVQSITLDGTTAQTFIPPANARWVKVAAGASNEVNLKIAFGTTATATVGFELEPGRSEDFGAVATLSVICKTAITDHSVFICWGV